MLYNVASTFPECVEVQLLTTRLETDVFDHGNVTLLATALICGSSGRKTVCWGLH